MALRVAVTLGIPARLRGDGDTVENLARELAVSPVGLELLLAQLATIGVVERTDAAYRTTAFGTPLCPDVDPWLTTLLDATTAAGRSELAFVEMAHSVATGQEAYSRRYGQDFWTDATEHPQRQQCHRHSPPPRCHVSTTPDELDRLPISSRGLT